jgi:FMN phosphatase YigB (HAD superfamily)
MQKKLLITDLDNTLYDWVTFFTASFRSMLEELMRLLAIEHKEKEAKAEQILREFQMVHQKYGNSEQPFAILEIPSVQQRFPGLSQAELIKELDPALHRFNSMRKRTLALYPGIADVLKRLSKQGITIVGHTEALLINAYWRLRALGVDSYFTRLYTLEGMESIYVPDGTRWVDPPPGFVTVLPREERKPNPRLISDICQREQIPTSKASVYYLGDSRVRDIPMAKAAGITAIWARYGTKYDPACWTFLEKISHWTDAERAKEKDLAAISSEVDPDYTIDSPYDLERIIPL